jgi:2-polyprenyl-3-methyl-5-hydroxy-6-metoxy-1,4-benzoquinol methylase
VHPKGTNLRSENLDDNMSAPTSKQHAVHTAIASAEGYRTVVPLPSEQELADFYSNIYFQVLPTTTYQREYTSEELAHKRLRAELTVQLALRRISPVHPAPSLLDVGFGEGFELAAALNAGFVARGVDFGSDGLRRCNPTLESVVEAGDPLEAVRTFAAGDVRFDVCVLKNVLEHVREPKSVLQLVRQTLNKDGIVVVTVPNDYSAFQAELLSRGSVDSEYWFAPPQHLQYFNTENFGGFAASLGFDVVDLVGDFPIELYLLHPGSNYVRDPANGPGAHSARVATDLFLARRGLEPYADVCRALAVAGLSRTMTAYLRPRRS